jgi:hypothetical protein
MIIFEIINIDLIEFEWKFKIIIFGSPITTTAICYECSFLLAIVHFLVNVAFNYACVRGVS